MTSSSAQPPRVGTRFEIVRQLGEGGMARVYEVRDTLNGERCAIKELSPRGVPRASADALFRNEFRLMAKLQHPNLVRVFDYAVGERGVPYIVMEYVEGEDLFRLSPLEPPRVADILAQLCHTLSYLHSRLFVHRDLKPANIRCLEDGTIKILDYGLMAQLGTAAPRKIAGTYHYLAPELVTGGVIDGATDLYSVGIIGYELLTGRKPFLGSRKELLAAHVNTTPPEPSALCPEVPASLGNVVMRLLSKSKQERYRDAESVLRDLAPWVGPERTSGTSEQRQSYLYSSVLIGRSKEVDEFKRVLARLKKGVSGGLFVGAGPGFGKTRLLSEMHTLTCVEGIRCLYAKGKPNAQRIYGWLNTLIGQLAGISPPETLQRFGPDLEPVAGIMLRGDTTRDQEFDDKAITGATLAWLRELVAKEPLALFIDDLHLTDLKSLQVLNTLLRGLRRNLLVVGNFRSTEVERASPLWHPVEEGLVRYLTLTPFNKQQTREILDGLLYPSKASDALVTLAFRYCGGNPLDLSELLRFLITKEHLTRSGTAWLEVVNPEEVALPETLEERLIGRLSALSHSGSGLAHVGAVLDEPLDLDVWQAVAGYDETRFFDALDELVAHQIVARSEEGYAFCHHRIQEILGSALSEEKRQAYHLGVARFAALHRRGVDGWPTARIARHFVAANEPQSAITLSLEAAREAEQKRAEWAAFAHYKDAARFLDQESTYEQRDALLLAIYEKPASLSSAAWIDATTCEVWLRKAIAHHTQRQDTDKVFALSIAYLVTTSITSNYEAARSMVPQIVESCEVEDGTILWAILYGTGVCLIDWYQGYQRDLFEHAQVAIDIFESHQGELAEDVWPAYSWALFWREKARSYQGLPVDMDNIARIEQMMREGRSDSTVYWHALTAVGARACFTGRWAELLGWKEEVSRRSAEMGKIHWFECWISHSYLYGALDNGEFAQVAGRLEQLQASPDQYQARLASLFQGRWKLLQGAHQAAEAAFEKFFEQEARSRDNSYLEGLIYLAITLLETGRLRDAEKLVHEGLTAATEGVLENPLYELQFRRLHAELCVRHGTLGTAKQELNRALELAIEADNPIQIGHTERVLGVLEMQRGAKREAIAHLQAAKAAFLCIDNRYQAGSVARILDVEFQPTMSRGEIAELQRQLQAEDRSVGEAPTEAGPDPALLGRPDETDTTHE